MKIRTIKPDFWSSKKLTRVPREVRLFFAGLFNMADDEGRMLGITKELAGALFPFDDDVDGRVIESWLTQLAAAGLIERYEVSDRPYVAIPGFLQHQRLDKRYPSRLPAPPSDNPEGPADNTVGPSDKVESPTDNPEGPADNTVGPSDKVEGPTDNPAGLADTPLRTSDFAVLEGGLWKVEGGGGNAPAPAQPVVKTIQPTLSVAAPRKRWSRGILGDDERALEPKTVGEFLACAYEYPHHPAKPGQETFGDVLRRDLGATFDGHGTLTLERAIEIGGWAHWQSADERESVRWVWPAQAPGKIEKWVRDDASKALQAKLTQRRADAQGIDLTKPAAKVDPLRTELAKAYRVLQSRDADDRLPPLSIWIDRVIAEGRVDEELGRMARSAPAAAAGNTRAASAGGPPSDADARKASKAAYDAFVATVPPQDRAAGLPSWRDWTDAGSPPRWTGPLRQGSGGQPRQPPTGSAANQPPADDPDEVDDDAIADAKAKLAALSSGIARPKPKRPLTPGRDVLDRMLPEGLTTEGGAG